MKTIVKIENGSYKGQKYTTYTFQRKHILRKYDNGVFIAYTPSGNYTSLPTMYKLRNALNNYLIN